MRKILEFFLSENFHFFVVTFSVQLNRHVFVMRAFAIHENILVTVLKFRTLIPYFFFFFD